jgi:hypothetical protein
MNYELIYNKLIERGRERVLEGYKEKHHIIPRCMGGTDEESNLVSLTPEEHYIAHQLLVKINPNNYKLIRAAAMMIPKRLNNKMYGWLRRKFSKAQSASQSGQNNSQSGTFWITNGIEEAKTIEQIPLGWERGRIASYHTVRAKEAKKKQRQQKMQLNLLNKQKELSDLYNIYCKEGFSGVQRIGYKHSQPNLVKSFSKYLPDFVPQNGKKRGSMNNL